MNEADKAREILTAKFLRDIEEFCDGCQVVMSGQDPNGETWSFEGGVGNWHARLWVAENFVKEYSGGGGESSATIRFKEDEDEEDEE